MNKNLIPAMDAVIAAEQENLKLGHENLGSLSLEWGLLPKKAPLQNFPSSFALWDKITAELPQYYRTQDIRYMLDNCPIIDATEDSLPDEALCRAATVIGVTAHAYYWLEPGVPESLPESIMSPWQEVCRRLARKQTCLTYSDLILNNWQLKDPSQQARTLNNINLLIETIAKSEERIFYGAQVEMAYCATPLIKAMLNTQQAVVNQDIDQLIQQFEIMGNAIENITHAFRQIQMEYFHQSYCDPVIWGKEVAPLAVAFQPGVEGPSGTAAPYFHLLDIFFSRPQYESKLGQDQKYFRSFHYSKHLSQFASALSKIDTSSFVLSSRSNPLKGSYHNLINAYVSNVGLLGVHRTKVYGYLTTAFKVGRTVTVGGSITNNSYLEKAWHHVDSLLKQAQSERQEKFLSKYSRLKPVKLTPCHHVEGFASVNQIDFDISNTSIKYNPGDACEILPMTSKEIIRKTLQAFGADGSEPVKLTKNWRKFLANFEEYKNQEVLTLAEMLKLGETRQLSYSTICTLQGFVGSDQLQNIIDEHQYDQYEFWEILDILQHRSTYTISHLWKAKPWEKEHICHIILPARPRLYSISSSQTDTPKQLSITVASLIYPAKNPYSKNEHPSYGSCSSYLNQLNPGSQSMHDLTARIIPGHNFSLPRDASAPIVMFAGGSGISPFIGFIKHRISTGATGDNILFYSTRTRDLIFHQELLQKWVKQGHLKCCINFSQDDCFIECKDNSHFKLDAHPRCHIQDIMLQPSHSKMLLELLQATESNEEETCFYICGQPGFADTVLHTLWKIIKTNFNKDYFSSPSITSFFGKIVSNRQLMLSIYTPTSPIASSHNRGYTGCKLTEIARHNNPQDGYWFVIYDHVYDVSSFVKLHPGGDALIKHLAGIDATEEFIKSEHDNDPSIKSMLSMYKIGYVDKAQLPQAWSIRMTNDGLAYISFQQFFKAWIKYFYLIIEMENGWFIEIESITQSVATMTTADFIYQTSMIASAHQGFYHRIFSVLLSFELQEIWSMVLAFFDPTIKFGELIIAIRHHLKTIEKLNASYHQKHQTIKRKLLNDNLALSSPEKTLEYYQELINIDSQFIRKLKLATMDGTKIFEKGDGQAILDMGEELVNIINNFPDIAEQYANDLKKIYDKMA